MRVITTYKLTGLCLVTAFAAFGWTACGSDDYRSDKGSAAATDSTVNANPAAPADKTADNDRADTTAAANGKKPTHKWKTAITMPHGSNSSPVKDREGVYNTAEVMPQFPGGQGALEDYVNNSVDYPQQAIDQNTTGTVMVSFIVDENGKVMNAHLMGGQRLGNGLDEEAVRVVGRMPAWKPGKVKGKNVRTRLELPINFQVEA